MKQINNNLIKQIFTKAGLGKISSIQKIEVGFSNDVYSIDDKYILKIGKTVELEDEEYLKKDIYFCNLFKNKLPVPKIIYSDTSKKLTDKIFFIYHKIHGDNLYNVWHLCNDTQRKRYVKQICDILKKINKTSYKEFVQKFNVDTNLSWKDNICSKIEADLKKIVGKKYLPKETVEKVRQFVGKNKNVLKEEKMALTYWDAHFDNFLVSKEKIVGILDFERIEIASIDYILFLVRLMISNPTKYASEHAEQFIVAEDYAKLMHWYREFYPEIFDFPHLEKRADFYSLEHCLSDIYYFPKIEELKKELSAYLS